MSHATDTAGGDGLAGLRVLLVEPEVARRERLRRMLRTYGAEVVTDCSCPDGVTAAVRHQPDLIVFDPDAAGEAGVHTYRRLRRDPRIDDIPVFVVAGERGAHHRLCDQGVAPPDGFVVREVDERELLGALQRTAALRRRRWARRCAQA